MSASPQAPEAGPTTAALALRSVHAGYGSTQVLRDVSLTVPRGTVTALIGPNGAGKTTTLRVASGLLRPTAGTVVIGSDDVTAEPSHRRAARGLVHVPEGRGVYRNLTVEENLTMQAFPRRAKEAIERAAEVFPVLGRRLRQRAGTLSGGEQQMLSLSAAYVRRPELVLVDEPSLGLAPIVVDVVFEFLETVKSRGTSLSLVDQFAHRSLAIAERAYVLRRGQVVFDGAADELLTGDMFEKYVGDGVA